MLEAPTASSSVAAPSSPGVEVMGPEFLGLPPSNSEKVSISKTAEAKAEEPIAEATNTEEPVAEESAEGDEAKEPAKLLAGVFKTPEELEADYSTKVKALDASGREAKRLLVLSQRQENIIGELQDKMAEMELKSQLSTFQERTNEELAEMSESEKMQYKLDLRDHKQLKKELEEKQQAMKAKEEEIDQAIDNALSGMKNDPEVFSDLDNVVAQFPELIKEEPALQGCGIPKMPYIMYWAIYGRNAKAKELQASKVQKESKAQAAKKAASDASRAGAPAATGGKVTGPAGKTWDSGFAESLKTAAPKPIF